MTHRYGNSPITDDKTQMSKTGAQVSAISHGRPACRRQGNRSLAADGRMLNARDLVFRHLRLIWNHEDEEAAD